MQIILSTNFFFLSEKNYIRTEPIVSPRGNIVDINGKLLATNRPILSLYWQGTGNKKFDEKQTKILGRLNNAIALKADNHEILQSEKYSKTICIAHDLSINQISTILEEFPDDENITIRTSFERFYPHQLIASHIVGYLGSVSVEKIGRMGLEMAFEHTLKGKTGIIEKTINSLGKKLSERKLKNALTGNHIKTTIDLQIQSIAEKVFPEHYAGAFIIMETKTGSISALVSRPSFNPNMFLKRITNDEWQACLSNQPFINRVFGACYPPASPFKLVTLAAGLELGIIDENTTWECKGSLIFGGRIHYCNKRSGHGILTAKQALAQSCNIPFFELAKEIPIDTLAHYAKLFGLGQKTNCIFPEKTGLIPTKKWKETTKGEPWWPGETLSAAIGQSYLLVTPIQMARMVSGIIEGKLIRPRILADEPIEETPFEINQKVRKFLKQSMRMVVTTGTGKRLSVFKDIKKFYAKTGTAQLCDRSKPNKKHTDQEHVWCLVYVKYKEFTPLSIAILLEHARAARYAIEIIKHFIIDYCKVMDNL